jgi:2,3-dihydroxybenzoate decarboxylase
MNMRIALEEHFIVDAPAHIERWKTVIPFIPESAVAKIEQVLCDVGEGRIAAMTQAGIDFAVLSNVGTVQGQLDAATAMKLAREANDHLAKAVQAHSRHFAGFATVPLQDPVAGAAEFERAVRDLGMKGALIIGQTGGLYLDHDRFSPFWERAQALDAPIYLHAADAAVAPVTYAGRPELEGATWSWTAETAAHTLRIIFGGVFNRFPKARLLLGHMGEALPYMLWRIDKRSQAFSKGETTTPSEIFRRNVAITTAGVFSNEPLDCALEALGEDSVMFSVDHPFEDMKEASSWLDAAPVQDAVREKISSGNARRILNLFNTQKVKGGERSKTEQAA